MPFPANGEEGYLGGPVTKPRPLALLFDLDGTLVDTIELILASARHAFAEHPGRRPTDADWIAGIGKPLRVQIEELAGRPEQVEPLVARYREYFWAHHDEMTRPFSGAVEVVSGLRAAGHPVGIVTAKWEEPAWKSLRLTGLAPFVDAVVGADSLPEHKPDPAPVRLLLGRLDRTREEALLVGDSPHDIAAGNAAGVTTAAALWGASAHEVLLQARPAHLLAAIGEVPGLVRLLEAAR
ncbi:MAG: HAD hydrolase-like protein [Deltaproteobacteria bacterium]|nr:HAD hydrolase-like protein [Deltaproteobacteria bacterium]